MYWYRALVFRFGTEPWVATWIGLCLVSSGESMDEAHRIIANWSGASDIVSRERIACSAWKKAVGKKIAERSQAVKLVRERLVVEVENDLWRSNLWGM